MEWKIGSTLALLFVTFGCSYLPWSIRSRFRNSKLIMSYLNCLAGGVVLGALLMHMIPEMSHNHLTELSPCGGDHKHGHEHGGHHQHHHHSNLSSLFKAKNHNHEGSMECNGHVHNHGGCGGGGGCGHEDHDHQPHDDKHGNTPKNEKSGAKKAKHATDKKAKHMPGNHGGCGDHHHHHQFATGPFWAGVSFLVLLAIDRLFMHSHSHDHDHGHGHSTNSNLKLSKSNEKVLMKELSIISQDQQSPSSYPQCHDVECGGKVHSADPENDDCASCHSEDLMGGCHMDSLNAHSSKTQALVFVIALSLHSFLEGLGMATKKSKEQLFLYLISLFAHKWLEAFALGVNVLNAQFSTASSFMLISFYAMLTPLGIVLGIFFERLTLNGPYAAFTFQCLNGLAVGSFLFVSCIEMIPPEFHKKTLHTPWKFLTLCLGFILMALVSILHIH